MPRTSPTLPLLVVSSAVSAALAGFFGSPPWSLAAPLAMLALHRVFDGPKPARQ
jgi:hypothetical protein